MANDKDNEYEKTPAAGKGGSPASSTPHEEARGAADDDKDSATSRTPKESKESAGGKGGGLH
ncbi:MAG: hypothetical protein LC803_02560 [Acidobacteria bacterium]|nr:hypothetical protein [Acidobacteriota bacterium]